MIYLMINFIQIMILMLFILLSVAFLTLLERKILGYIQTRKGPNKISLMGILQPMSDAIKLFSKEYFFMNKINMYHYMVNPMIMMSLSMLNWMIMPYFNNFIEFNNGFIYFYMLMSLSVYPIMLGSWSSNSLYSMLGSMRSIAQSISFEVSLFFMIFIILIMMENYSFYELYEYQSYMKFFIIFMPIYLMIFMSLLIELNRTPFDLIEGESELVSGFNTEYYSINFSLIFMAEYSNIMMMSMMITLLFFNFSYNYITLMFMIIHIFLIIWLRGVLPRIRYDQLMYMCWKNFMLISLIYFFFIFNMKFIMNYNL